ncbi:MAG: pyridoxal-phosphate dependent enzyme [Anaerolineales bacterium]|nr:pyridoxal-phosphate dependent enzyme [Anaerolineales bacterium]
MNLPTFVDVLHAQRIIGNYLSPTPLHHYPTLDELLDAQVYVKHENYQPIGVFKVRGGINLMSRLMVAEREQGVITASTGNHGQSIAYAAKLFNVRAVIVAPEGANPVKVEAIESHGAEVVFHGHDFDAAKDHCEHMAQEQGLRYISSGDEPYLIAGVGTYSLEILEQQPDVEMVFVPVGGGSGAAGTCLVVKTINPDIQVIGVQAAAAPSAYMTWKNRQYTTAQMETEAEGLATRTPFMLPQQILWQHLDDFVLVEEEAMRHAVRLYLEKAKTLAELAGAAPLAAALQEKERVRDKTIALVLSGGNVSPEKLRQCLL